MGGWAGGWVRDRQTEIGESVSICLVSEWGFGVKEKYQWLSELNKAPAYYSSIAPFTRTATTIAITNTNNVSKVAHTLEALGQSGRNDRKLFENRNRVES